MNYSILILSPVPIFENEGVFTTLDLWARDLQAQCAVSTVYLVCPVQTGDSGTAINPEIATYAQDTLSAAGISEIVSKVDVVQLFNSGWRSSATARQLLKVAKRLHRPVILGVSSNRAKAAWLNAKNKLKGAISYLDVRTAQSWFAFQADGVFVVGDGLRALFEGFNSNIHVGIASWIKEEDIAIPRIRYHQELNVLMASRLEKMKGMHIGVSAVGLTRAAGVDVRLSIIGDGPERLNIERQIDELGLRHLTTFHTTTAYPRPFLDFVYRADLVLLTNLSDEQPRLIFDAISQGCIPVCPDAPAYRDLGLSSEIFYKRGDANALSQAIRRLSDQSQRAEVSKKMMPLLTQFTIEQMHAARSDWVAGLIQQKAHRSQPD